MRWAPSASIVFFMKTTTRPFESIGTNVLTALLLTKLDPKTRRAIKREIGRR